MRTEVFMQSPMTGEKKKARTGFSWTSFFWGAWVPLFRQDWKWLAIMGPIQFVLGFFTFGIASTVVCIMMAIKYNGWHLNDLQAKGFVQITHSQFYNLAALGTVPAVVTVPAIPAPPENAA